MTIQVKKQSSPITPPAGMQGLFPNADGQWESVDSQGNRTPLAQGGGQGGDDTELILEHTKFLFSTNTEGITYLLIGRHVLSYTLPFTPVGKAVISLRSGSLPGFGHGNIHMSAIVAGNAMWTCPPTGVNFPSGLTSAEICDDYAQARRLTYAQHGGDETNSPGGTAHPLTPFGQLYAGALFGWYAFGGNSFTSSTSGTRTLIQSAWFEGNTLKIAVFSTHDGTQLLDGTIYLSYARAAA